MYKGTETGTVSLEGNLPWWRKKSDPRIVVEGTDTLVKDLVLEHFVYETLTLIVSKIMKPKIK